MCILALFEIVFSFQRQKSLEFFLTFGGKLHGVQKGYFIWIYIRCHENDDCQTELILCGKTGRVRKGKWSFNDRKTKTYIVHGYVEERARMIVLCNGNTNVNRSRVTETSISASWEIEIPECQRWFSFCTICVFQFVGISFI